MLGLNQQKNYLEVRVNTAIDFSTNNESKFNHFEERSILLNLATTAMHPSLDAGNRNLASKFLTKQLLRKLSNPEASLSEIKVYLDVFKEVMNLELFKTDNNEKKWNINKLEELNNFDEEFHHIDYIRSSKHLREKTRDQIHSSEELLINHLRWKVATFLEWLI